MNLGIEEPREVYSPGWVAWLFWLVIDNSIFFAGVDWGFFGDVDGADAEVCGFEHQVLGSNAAVLHIIWIGVRCEEIDDGRYIIKGNCPSYLMIFVFLFLAFCDLLLFFLSSVDPGVHCTERW